MKKQKDLLEKSFSIPIPLYKTRLNIVESTDVHLSRKNRNDLLGDNEEVNENWYAMFSWVTTGPFYVFVPKGYPTSVLVHELFHATHRILESRGVEFTEGNNEPYAYMLEYLTEQAISGLKQFKFKKVRTPRKKV